MRVLSDFRKMPEKADVVVTALDFWTPRMDMQVCIASMTTATPRGFRESWMQSRICSVRRSWTCRRRIGLHHAGDLGKAGDSPVRDIGHVRLADEGKHMVLAQREQLDVLDQDHLAVRLREDSGLDNLLAILEITLGQELHGFCHALRGLEETFPLDVLTEELEDGLDVPCEFLSGFFVVFFQLSICHGIVFAASSDGFGTAKLTKKNYYIPIFSLSLHP